VPWVSTGRKKLNVEENTPLDVALNALGERFFFSSVKYARPRGVMDDAYPYGHNMRVYVEGVGLVNPVTYNVKHDTNVLLRRESTLGSKVSGFFSERFKAGFQNSLVLRNRFGWRVARRVITSSANLPWASEFPAFSEANLKRVKTGVLIVGAGLAGLGVAESLSELGKECILVDTHAEPGGRTRFSKETCSNGETYSALTKRLIERLNGAKVELLQGCFGGLYEEKTGFIVSKKTITRVELDYVVYATGSRNPPPLFCGNDLPGVFSVDYALRLINYDALRGPVVIYSEDEWGAKVYERLKSSLGATLINPSSSETKTSGRIVRVEGRKRVKAVVLENGKRITAECLVYSTVRQPSLELPAQAGVRYELGSNTGLITAQVGVDGASDNPWLWLAGSVTGLYELESSYYHGRAVGYSMMGYRENAQQFLLKTQKRRAIRFDTQVSEKAFVCFCEDVTVGDFVEAKKKDFSHPEKIKRFTGWGTGACQGKMCVANGLTLIGVDHCSPYTQRLPVEPTPLGSLAQTERAPI
jgi:sarcosine oxidase subunit alpha